MLTTSGYLTDCGDSVHVNRTYLFTSVSLQLQKHVGEALRRKESGPDSAVFPGPTFILQVLFPGYISACLTGLIMPVSLWWAHITFRMFTLIHSAQLVK
jgi:hypothetical protein